MMPIRIRDHGDYELISGESGSGELGANPKNNGRPVKGARGGKFCRTSNSWGNGYVRKRRPKRERQMPARPTSARPSEPGSGTAPAAPVSETMRTVGGAELSP